MANYAMFNAEVRSFDQSSAAFRAIKKQGVQPSGAASGSLTGTYPSPTIAANAVTVANLANAVQDLIITDTITSDSPKAATNAITVTIQIRDAAGNTLAGRRLRRVWFSTTEYGAPSAGGTFGSITSGAIIQSVTGDQDYWMITDSTGKIVLTVSEPSPGVLYCMEGDGDVGVATLTWT